ncbi:ATP-binding protein [Leucobacter sp. CSA1]|uniref:ATP-binding protein n=1 Tax=Leucobacter chromiisoli TaxID=2796471 RepID=A0A934UUG9_9MICO|nr:ATP-binding protein [Leucobacter chromiisoli]MBK0418805.1 ATP-binding protein [Leucobacter chromiisoli]
MRSPLDNPFTPGSDTVPVVWAGRISQLTEWSAVVRPRLHAGMPERGRTILGEPGLGKSTLVRRIAEKAAADGDWVTPQVRLPAGADPLKAVAAAILRLSDQAGLAAAREQRITGILERVRQVAASGISLTIDRATGPEPYSVLTELLIEVGVAARRAGRVVLVHIDEIQNVSDENALSQLLISLGDAITAKMPVELPGGIVDQRALPIAVYLTGLPEFAEKASSRSGATFARRFATNTLEPISDEDLLFALSPFIDPGWESSDETGGISTIRMTPEAAEMIVSVSCGEPFLFQLAGERAWYAGTGDVITLDEVVSGWEAARHEATAHVERILDRLPPKEQEFVTRMAEMDPKHRTLTGIARAMGYDNATNAGPFAQRLDTVRGIISRGRKYTFRHRALEAYLTTGWPELESGTSTLRAEQGPQPA